MYSALLSFTITLLDQKIYLLISDTSSRYHRHSIIFVVNRGRSGTKRPNLEKRSNKGKWSLGSFSPKRRLLVVLCLKSLLVSKSACNFGITNTLFIYYRHIEDK